MRNRLAGAALAMLVLAACGGQSAGHPAPTAAAARAACPDMQAVHHAYVVVQHLSGTWFQSCIGFDPAFIDGQTILDRSGIEYLAEAAGSSKLVCQMDLEPAHVTACGGPAWPRWVAYVEVAGKWSPIGTDYSAVRLYDRQAIGWRFARTALVGPPPQAQMISG